MTHHGVIIEVVSGPVAVSLDGRPPVYWPEPFAKMLRHLKDVMDAGVPFDQWELTLRCGKNRVTAMGPTPFRPDRWETSNTAGGVNISQEVA